MYFRSVERMGNEKLISEKTPVLHVSKTPFDYDSKRERQGCSRTTLSWILASVLLVMLILLSVLSALFLYPSYDEILIREEPIEVRMIPPRLEETVYEANHPVKPSKTIGKLKTTGNGMNPWDFEFLINPLNLCATINLPNSVEYQNNPEVKLLVLVPSAIDHFDERRAIRNTWGSVAERPLGPMRLGFVLGSTTNKTIDDLIHEESSKFRDIIQIDFVESYQQMTTKSILMLKWVAKMCPHAQYFLKADDDTFVNIRTIADLLNKEPYISGEKSISGYVQSIDSSLKFPEMLQEFHIMEEDFPLEDFPPYASSSYVMSIPTAIDLFGASKEVEPFYLEDDAFLTGVCAKHSGVPLIHEPSFIIKDPPMPPSWNTYSSLATAHSVTPDALEQVWNEMTKSITNIKFYFETAINSTGNSRAKKNV